MRFRSGEGSVFQAWRLPFGASFLCPSVHKATLGYVRHYRLQAVGPPSCTGMLFWSGKGKRFSGSRLQAVDPLRPSLACCFGVARAALKATLGIIGNYRLQAASLLRPSLALFGVARAAFFRPGLELVSCRPYRK